MSYYPTAKQLSIFFLLSIISPPITLCPPKAWQNKATTGESVVSVFRKTITTRVKKIFKTKGFAGNTLVKTPYGYQPISMVKEGDLVLAADGFGLISPRKIQKTRCKKSFVMYNLILKSPTNEERSLICAAPLQQFYYSDPNRKQKNRWVTSQNINSEETFCSSKKTYNCLPCWVTVRSTSILENNNKMCLAYEIEVEADHTFFVTKYDIWVHD